jgi:hypothetical protein
MSKTYKDIHEEPIMASEPVAAYGEPTTYAMPSKSVPAKERIMASTVSVDEYFDELITLVHKDYADL